MSSYILSYNNCLPLDMTQIRPNIVRNITFFEIIFLEIQKQKCIDFWKFISYTFLSPEKCLKTEKFFLIRNSLQKRVLFYFNLFLLFLKILFLPKISFNLLFIFLKNKLFFEIKVFIRKEKRKLFFCLSFHELNHWYHTYCVIYILYVHTVYIVYYIKFLFFWSVSPIFFVCLVRTKAKTETISLPPIREKFYERWVEFVF